MLSSRFFSILTVVAPCGCLALLAVSQAEAATAEEEGIRQNEQLLRQQQQMREQAERRRLFEELERSLRTPVVEVEPVVARGQGGEQCFTIHSIVLAGAEQLLQAEKKALTQPYLGTCMSLADIDKLRTDIDRFYIEKGWVMSRSYLEPKQNISEGVLRFRILEGTLDGIDLNENKLRQRAQVATAFPDMEGEVINIRDIEQGLDQMNRLASNRATMNIAPVDDKPGYSSIRISNTPQDQLRSTIGVDNMGSTSSGRERFSLSGQWDNLLAVNDAWTLSASAYAGEDKESKDSNTLALSLGLPYGYWTYTLNASYSDYLTTSEGDAGEFQLSGESSNISAKAGRMLVRGKSSKTTAAVNFSLSDSESFLEDVKLESGSRKLSVMDLELVHVLRTTSASWSFLARYSRGLDLFDALVDGPERDPSIPRAQYEKWRADVSTTMPIRLKRGALSYSANIALQYSRDPLFGSAQISLGDAYTVRGFRDSPVAGDDGFYLKQDLNWQPEFSPRALQGLMLGVGLDAGRVEAKNNNIFNSGAADASLAGAAISASQSLRLWRQQQLSWSLTAGWPLYEPDEVDAGFEAYVSLNWKWI